MLLSPDVILWTKNPPFKARKAKHIHRLFYFNKLCHKKNDGEKEVSKIMFSNEFVVLLLFYKNI